MFKKFTNGCVHLVQRFLPDAFIFCIILTIVVFIAAIPVTGMNPLEVADCWGQGIWELLAFSMQMALVLVFGTAFANAPAVKRLITRLASVPKQPVQAIIFVTVISMLCCWLNWGFGLVVGAILAKEIAKKVARVDYRLLIASAYSGFVVWHGGISGSIPLTLASWDESLKTTTAGAVTASVPTSETIFAPWNLILVAVIILVVSFVNARMHPADSEVVAVDPALLIDETEKIPNPHTPAEKLENSMILSWVIAALGIVYLVFYFVSSGSFNLSLNIVNLIFLVLGLIFHKTPISYVRAIMNAAKSAGGIILQFPFYAGIMGIMTGVGAGGISLAGAISSFFVNISNTVTFPVFSFLAAGVVNFFVPSGGGQWAVQAPIMMPAGNLLGVAPAITGMAISWGDAWTNMLQPFWALPALGIAGLGARDIMGYCAVVLIVTGLIICGGFLFLVPLLA
ncbi:Short-chain fatty acids transporter [uncultured Roseburia sp.]|uniref:Short-chain fatty acid transporter n=1 Tax=Brotonthovivens ammoniilytica TaxID=2981725 RepID=A0ABT2TN86_9FIRM|nr:short-chain fatty acid transporter [Brotonthovivens ammoniilytica]MCU6763141.1 short-chain fatty acid transporter [Brotonthovivens ammoniilytica]SCJ04562.1 Short-chain fatty acids transporter [uncultured Roseburia sp.]